MISEERLNEIINNEEQLWVIDSSGKVIRLKMVIHRYGISVDKYNKLHNSEPMLYSNFCGFFTDICPISQVFETEEEANEYLKYGNVTRTEKFPYVSWEEFCKGICFSSYDPMKKISYYVWRERNYIYIKEYYNSSDGRIFFKEPLTRENYRKALDICVKLFKGEEVYGIISTLVRTDVFKAKNN